MGETMRQNKGKVEKQRGKPWEANEGNNGVKIEGKLMGEQ